ncbi:helix-turn-helix domain-containing protein [Hydrogenophaga sp.]|uniref:helix-turn-helix domain-containing protein n=1 Tax=Hydrogenophaga sp. TaxID=1904254 RepID=UPI00271A3D33|nr:helix-turn-helix domain-containing protein [Hydrogenophaga sp.]MDO8904231.1 helix-turn-helix domain-containing protein [Hydrogenophaga sp.]
MPPPASPSSHTTHQPFFQTPDQRTALARQRFFEEGIRPSGLVGEPVLQSWLRCCSAHLRPFDSVSFEPVSRSRAHASLNRNRQLLQAGNTELGHMEAALGGTDCRVLLTDAQGVIIHATDLPQNPGQPLLRAAARVGVNIAESHIGTSAPGIVVRTGEACSVAGGEHFHQSLKGLYCAAAPIHDIHGQLAGVLDVSVEGGRFPFDAAAVVGTYATTIENRLLQLQSTEHLLLHFQASPTFLDTPLEALAGVSPCGRVLWLNGAGRRLTGCHMEGRPTVDSVFGTPIERLMDLHRQKRMQTLRLPNGLGVWVKGRMCGDDGADFNHAVAVEGAPAGATSHPHDHASPPPMTLAEAPSIAAVAEPARTDRAPSSSKRPTLVDHSQRLIEVTLAECGGNIAKAARALGVSRGMLYRRLQKPAAQGVAADTTPAEVQSRDAAD